jgi:hypothetical protein
VAAVVVADLAEVAVVAGHRTAVAGVGHIDRKFDTIY